MQRRGDVWHYDFTVNGKRYRGSTKQRSKPKARDEEARQRQLAELGAIPSRDKTLREAADAWFASKIAGKKSASTVALRIEVALRAIGPDCLCSTIDAPDIEQAIQRRRLEVSRAGKVPSNATVNRDLIDTTLRPLFRYCRTVLKIQMQAVDWRELRLAEPEGRSRTFTLGELRAWRSKLPEHHRPLFDFIATYGVRLSEAFFPLDNFDPETGRIVLRQRKNGKPHAIRLLPDDARELAARFGRAREGGLATVWFCEGKDGLEPIARRGFQSASYNALRAAGVADARAVHDLRHHAATAFLRLPGASLKHVQQLLGHESIASTARYAHVSTDDVFEIMRRAGDTKAGEEPKSAIDSKDRTGT